MVDEKKRIKIITKNQILKKKFEAIINSVEGFEVQPEGEEQAADLLIFELGSDPDYDFEIVQSMLQSGAAEEVFLTAEKSNPDLLIKAMRVGAREFFAQPIKDEEVKEALRRLRQEGSLIKRIKLSRVINVVGSKGGVGTTTVAVNLATSLVEITGPDSVVLVDMNLATPETPLFLNLKPGYHWGKIAQNITRLDPTFMMSVLNKHSSGVYSFSSSRFSDQETVSPEVVERVINILRRMFNFIVIDSGGVIESTYRRILQLSDIILLVINLTLPCATNAKKILEMFEYWGYPPREKIYLVVNRYLKNSQIPLSDLEESLNHKVFWTIPNDYPNSLAAINKGEPLITLAPKAQLTESFRKLAVMLAGKEQKSVRQKSSFFTRFFS